MFKVDELLLLVLITYFPDVAPLYTVLGHEGKTVKEYLDGIQWDDIEDEKEYASFMTGYDFKNIIKALRNNDKVAGSRIVETHRDEAYGGGGGISAIFLCDEYKEAVVAFRGTADNEWIDDCVGANKIDTLQQINAMEWYKSAYEKLGLEDYTVTVTGHSKGGNKAKYIGILNDTPDRAVSFDGQGFSDEFIEHYRRRIQKRQGIIENHNIDFDYVNILMNDVGRKTYYVGYDYGKHGFAESHCPNTFMNFGENGEYTMQVNPNGQRPEMQILDQFFNSMIRSGVSKKEQEETNRLVGVLVERAFSIGKDQTVSEYINLLCDLVGDPQYSDNTAYLLAFCIKYSKLNKDFLKTLKDLMHNFGADEVVKILNMLEGLVNSRKFSAIVNLSDFLIHHVNRIVVSQVQNFCSKKYGIQLSQDQVRGVLQIVSLTKEMMKTLEIKMDGSDIVVSDEDDGESLMRLPEDMKIVVLAGGLSNERNMSRRSGYVVSRGLAEKGYQVILLDSFMGYGDYEMNIPDAFADTAKYTLEPGTIPNDIPDLWAVRKRRVDQSSSYFGPNVLQICRQADLVFIALHGAEGENGKVQAAFDLLGIDYTGCDYFSSALSSNKSVSKQLLAEAGIPVPKGYLLFRGGKQPEPTEMGMSYPVIVKPNNGGIGLGISVASDQVSFRKALKDAFRWESDILVEEYVAGREFAVGALDGKALPVLEVLPFKTRSNETDMSITGEPMRKCPADIPDNLTNNLKKTAEKVVDILGVKAYGKVDFIVREDGSFVCLECDSLPQLYQDAHFVVEAMAEGLTFGDLCDHILEMSLRND